VNFFSLFFTSWLLAAVSLLGSGEAFAASDAESNVWKTIVASSLSLIYVTNPLEADRMVVETGGGESVYIVRGAAQWDWKENILELFGFGLDTYVQFDYMRWQSTKDSSQKGANNSVGFAPVFRFTRKEKSVTYYLDTSIGMALLSSTKINASRFGSKFQFSGLLGIGALLGDRRQWGVGYKFNHMSNNSIELPNDGINFHLVSISYKY